MSRAEYTYDAMGRILRKAQVYKDANNARKTVVTAAYTYYPNGNWESMAYPNGVTAYYTYYADNRLHTLANMRGDTYLNTFNYAYNGAGNMTTKLELKGTTTYSYDAVGRLESVTEPDGKATQYAFDAAGNRLTETVEFNNSVTITQYNYNNQGRLTSSVKTSDDAIRKTGYCYDNNGSQTSNLVSCISAPTGNAVFGVSQAGSGAGGDITFEINRYDAFGRLTSVQNDNYIANYEYNADGLWISKEVIAGGAASFTKFLYEGGLVTLELDGDGNQTAYNVYGSVSVISRTTAQGVDYYLYNGRGDVA